MFISVYFHPYCGWTQLIMVGILVRFTVFLLLKNMHFGSFNVFPNFDFDDQSSLLIHKYLF